MFSTFAYSQIRKNPLYSSFQWAKKHDCECLKKNKCHFAVLGTCEFTVGQRAHDLFRRVNTCPTPRKIQSSSRNFWLVWRCSLTDGYGGCLSWAASQGFRGKLTWNLNHLNQTSIFGFHVNFPGCTPEFMKHKWLLNKKVVCYTKLLFSGVWVVLLLDFLPVFHGSLDGQRKDMFRKLAPKYLPVLKRNIPPHTPKTNMTMENPPFEDVFPIENWDFPIVILVFRGVNCTRFAQVPFNTVKTPVRQEVGRKPLRKTHTHRESMIVDFHRQLNKKNIVLIKHRLI